MGNCQTAEAAAVVIQHPPCVGSGSGRVERAAAVMAANPGHYVAAVIQTGAALPANANRRLKLLRPDDTLALGGMYRLVSFEEVLREFVSKRHAAASRVVLTADYDAHRSETDCSLARAHQQPRGDEEPISDPGPSTGDHRPLDPESDMVLGSFARLHGQWRPALPSITEGSPMY